MWGLVFLILSLVQIYGRLTLSTNYEYTFHSFLNGIILETQNYQLSPTSASFHVDSRSSWRQRQQLVME